MQQLKNLLGFCFLFFGSIVEIFRMWNKGIGSQRKKKKWNEIEKNIEQVVIGGIKNKKKKKVAGGRVNCNGLGKFVRRETSTQAGCLMNLRNVDEPSKFPRIVIAPVPISWGK